MGEAHKDALKLGYDRRLKLDFHGTKVKSKVDLPVNLELNKALRPISAIAHELRGILAGRNTQHSLTAPLRQSCTRAPFMMLDVKSRLDKFL